MRYRRYTRNVFVDFIINILIFAFAMYLFAHALEEIVSYAQLQSEKSPVMTNAIPTISQTRR